MDTIAVLDFGSQYTDLLASRLRKRHYFAEVMDYDTKVTELGNPKGIILSGSPDSVGDSHLKYDRKIWELGIPILGVCYGA